MKVGILYPTSKAYPDADLDFVDGIKSRLKAAGETLPIELNLEGVGFGGSEKEVYSKAEKLLRFDRVDLIVAFIDLKVTPLLEPLFFSADKLLIVVNPGANYPQNWTAQPNIIYLNLQHAFLAWLTGALASPGAGTRAAIATTFYDCGYLHNSVMIRHFMQLGGMPAYNYVNNQVYDEQFEISPLLQFLASDISVKKLLCTFDSGPAALFYKRLQEAAESENLQLYASPMMLDQAALNGLANGFRFSVDGYIPWHASLENDANQQFKNAFEEFAGRPVNLFALLGWEAALVLEEILSRNKSAYEAEAIVGQLADAGITSPRGVLRFDPETNHFVAPAIRYHIAKGATEISSEEQIATEEDWAQFRTLQHEGISSGWLNTYLCY